MKKQGLLAILLMLTMTSCVTTGKNFPSDLAWIKKENTKKSDVKMVLGPPFAIGNSGGVVTWTYAFYKYQLFGKTSHKELKFYWNPNHSVKHFSFNSSFPDDLNSALKKAGSPAENSTEQPSSKKRLYPKY
ncbi:MAG: hypothetical protein HRU09_15050 [Oligoflexales bacterium]|nr:hypothetical protein [Oligoflexales bacterium]